MANIRYRSWAMAIRVCLLFNFAVIFNFNEFLFLPRRAQSLGDVPTNRKNASVLNLFSV